ncbi:MAG: DUF885 domain-containing protein [Candidatus Neomarinimicrobiota bacterium]
MQKSIVIKNIILLLSIFLISSGLKAQLNLDRKLDLLKKNKELNDQKRMYKLFDIIWEWEMNESPESATYFGYQGQNHRWTDHSQKAHTQRVKDTQKILKILLSLNKNELDEKGSLDLKLILRDFDLRIESFRFKSELMPINQMGGVQQDVSAIIMMMPTNTIEDYKNIMARLKAVPKLIDQTISSLKTGLNKSIIPPKITLRNVPKQIMNLLPEDPLESPMLIPFQNLPNSIPLNIQEDLKQEALNIISRDIYPAYKKLHQYLTYKYIPNTRESIALEDLPDGKDWYRFNVKYHTTTNKTADEIHNIGLKEIERIYAEQKALIKATGFKGTYEEFSTFLRTDSQFFFASSEQLIGAYQSICKKADPELIKLFGTLPRLPYGVKKVPSYAEKSQTTAYYQGGSLAAGRPGYFFANTYNLKSRPKWEMEALTLHEAVPGHHLQIALAQELDDIHILRKNSFYTAYTEGWGLYAESLGEEMNFYTDPYAKYGQLTYEMWRAVRLVVDTGMHHKGWTRQQAIDLFKAKTAKTEHDIVVEVDRYIVWPGQALAYKIGELKIKELKNFAEKELGDKFNIRNFHDLILGHGSLPLNILEDQVKVWVNQQRESF